MYSAAAMWFVAATFNDWFLGPDQWFSAATDPYVNIVGVAMFTLIVGAGIVVALAIYSDSMALPTVVGIFISGAVVSWLPPQARLVAMIGIAVGLLVALYVAMRRTTI